MSSDTSQHPVIRSVSYHSTALMLSLLASSICNSRLLLMTQKEGEVYVRRREEAEEEMVRYPHPTSIAPPFIVVFSLSDKYNGIVYAMRGQYEW